MATFIAPLCCIRIQRRPPLLRYVDNFVAAQGHIDTDMPPASPASPLGAARCPRSAKGVRKESPDCLHRFCDA
jgi:hypothetical protein